MFWTARHLRAGVVMPVGVFLLGLGIAAFGGRWLHDDIDAKAAAEFQRSVERVTDEVSRRFRQPIYGLNGAKGMYAARPQVSRADFRAYVDARDLQREFPGVRGFGFIERIRRDGLGRFLATQRADGAPRFAIRQLEDKDHDDLYVIKFIEPPANNAGAQGLDVGSEERRRTAARRAVDTGQPTLTAPITLVQDNRRSPGLLLYVPVYAPGAQTSTVDARRASLVGLLYAPIVIAELLDGVYDVVAGRVTFEVFDAAAGQPQGSPVYDSDARRGGPEGGSERKPGRRFQAAGALSLPGREMTLRVSSTPQFEAAFARSTPWLAFVGGALASAMLAMLLWQQASGRRRAEALARRMTADLERLAQVVKHTSNAVSITDRDLRINWINEGFTRISGYTLGEAAGKTPGELLGSGKADPAVLKTLADSAAAGTACRVEILNRAKDGREYWIHTEIQPLRDARGRLTGFMEIGTDITERKLAEAALRDSEHMMRLVTENMAGRLAYFDSQRRLKFANKATYDTFGGTPAQRIGITFDELLGPERAREYGPMADAVLRGVPQTYEAVSISPDGRRSESVVHLVPDIRDGVVHGFVAMSIDVSLIKRAEQEVRRAEALLRGAIETIDEAFVLYDPDDRLVFCNDKYRQIYATSADLIVPGASFEDIVRKGAERGQYAQAIGRVDAWVAERVAAHRAGNTTLVQRLDDGRTLRIVERKMPDGHSVGFRIDITELAHATEAAQEASHAKSQFLANISHEIRTPLHAVLGMLALLRKTELTPRQADYAAKTDGAARSLLRLLDDILDFSKAEAGKMTLDPQPFRVDEMLRDLAVILSANVGAKDIELSFDVDPAMPRCLVGDAMRLQQVLINLGGNAIKFTDEGKVVVSLAVVKRDDEAVALQIAVRDTGIGIAPENQARIFSGFTQAEASTTRRFGGTGLGLAISQRLVALMGGELELDSTLGAGSRFHFCLTLPVAAEVAGAEPVDASPMAPLVGAGVDAGAGRGDSQAVGERVAAGSLRLAGMHLLVVEDNVNNQQVAREVLEDEGAIVQIASHGQEAVDAIAAGGPPFDVVLMDLQMPVMDGFTATSRIRMDLGMQSLPIVAMTANALASDREACLAAGMSDHVGKPFELSHLVRVLRKHARRLEAPDGADAAGRMAVPAAVSEAAAAAGVEIGIALDRLGGHIDLYQRMLRSVVDDVATVPARLQAYVAHGQTLPACQLLHTLKGLASTLGASALAAAAERGERQLGAELAPAEAASVVQQCAAAIASASPGLATLLNSLPTTKAPQTAPATVLDAGAFETALETMTEHLRNADMAATDAMAELWRRFGAAFGARLQPMDEAINALDFERALQLCNELIEDPSR